MLPEEQAEQLPLLLRAGLGPLRLQHGQGQEGPGLPLQGRPGRQDRHRRPPPGQQGRGPDRRGARTSPRAPPPSRPPASRTGSASSEYRDFAAEVREETGGIPIGFKLSAQHIEEDIDFALEIGVDYIILDGRGGGTGAAPLIFRDNISVPTIPALARARRHLDALGSARCHPDHHRWPPDRRRTSSRRWPWAPTASRVSNSAIQAIGCLGMRACNTDNCPVGIATQKPEPALSDSRSSSRPSGWSASSRRPSTSCR